MSHTMTSNVYYLPVPTPDEPDCAPRARTPWTALRNAWWRVRLTMAELRAAFRRAGRRARVMDGTPFFDGMAELTETAPAAPKTPARVIDFNAARRRRELTQAEA